MTLYSQIIHHNPECFFILNQLMSFKFKDSDGRSSKETINTDTKAGLSEIDVQEDKGYHMKLINDFRKVGSV